MRIFRKVRIKTSCADDGILGAFAAAHGELHTEEKDAGGTKNPASFPCMDQGHYSPIAVTMAIPSFWL
jgi:hypothetical protein